MLELGQLAYEGALRRRDQLQQEMDRCKRELDEVQTFLRLCARYAGMPDELPAAIAAAEAHSPRGAGEPQREPVTISGMDLLPHIRAAILEVGKPLKRGEIVRALEKRGIRVGGEEPARNIGTIMWRAKTERREFEAFTRFGYWPADVACPAAGYEPPGDDGDDGDDAPALRRTSVSTSDESPEPHWEQAAKSH